MRAATRKWARRARLAVGKRKAAQQEYMARFKRRDRLEAAMGMRKER